MGASLNGLRLLLAPPFWPLGAGAVGPRHCLAVSPSSVLADGRPGLLHPVLGALPAPLPPPAAPATSSTDTQGGVAEPAPPRPEELRQEVRSHPACWPNSSLPPGASSPGGTRSPPPAGLDGPAWCPQSGVRDSRSLQASGLLVFHSVENRLSARHLDDKIKQLFYTKCLLPVYGVPQPPPHPGAPGPAAAAPLTTRSSLLHGVGVVGGSGAGPSQSVTLADGGGGRLLLGSPHHRSWPHLPAQAQPG